MRADVVVIGGGPAGLSAGIALAQRGVSVLICESAAEPGNKPCGEGLLPGAVRELTRLGLDETALRAAGYPLLGVSYFSAAGQRAVGRFSGAPGLGVRRSVLNALLRQLAERTARLRVVHQEARLLVSSGSLLQVSVGGRALSPRLVIGADGLNSRTRKAAGLPSRRTTPFRYGMRQHFRVRAWTDDVEVYWGSQAEAYVTPTAEDEINVALLWQDVGRDANRGVRRAPDLFATFPELARRLKGAAPAGDNRASGPLRVEVPTPAADGLVLLGDAAGYVDAITGEGVGLAVAKAQALARVLSPALHVGHARITRPQLEPYLTVARKLERDHVRLTRLLLLLRRSPALMERAIGALAGDAELFRHFLAANQGQVSPFRLPLRSALGLARSLLREPSAGSADFEDHALRY